MSDQPTYEQALKELKEIQNQLESGEVDLDKITDKVKRASFLLGYCQKKLRSLENELNEIFDKED